MGVGASGCKPPSTAHQVTWNFLWGGGWCLVCAAWPPARADPLQPAPLSAPQSLTEITKLPVDAVSGGMNNTYSVVIPAPSTQLVCRGHGACIGWSPGRFTYPTLDWVGGCYINKIVSAVWFFVEQFTDPRACQTVEGWDSEMVMNLDPACDGTLCRYGPPCWHNTSLVCHPSTFFFVGGIPTTCFYVACRWLCSEKCCHGLEVVFPS